MRIIVCVKQLPDGTLNPFDASALECALGLCPERITLLSMGRLKAKDMLEGLTRLGPIDAVLLSDDAFAGADTLATSYTLSLWLKQQKFDYIFCGRQSIDGETGQVGPELASMLSMELVPLVMSVERTVLSDKAISCVTRNGSRIVESQAVLTMERSCSLRFPSLFSKVGRVTVLDCQTLGADGSSCGLKGSPTRVLASYENTGGRRNCRMIEPEQLAEVIEQSLKKEDLRRTMQDEQNDYVDSRNRADGSAGDKVSQIWITDAQLTDIAQSLAQEVRLVPIEGQTVENTDGDAVGAFLQKVREEKPQIILFPADWNSRCLAPQIAAKLKTGLCADCTELMIENGELHMVRPAFGGNLVAKIRCSTYPVMATVRTMQRDGDNLVLSVGKGALPYRAAIEDWAQRLHGVVAASRACVETGDFPYEYQVGLTGRSVSPKVYVALGISGAIHHVVGMERSQTVIAVNSDPQAEIFKYADYGVCCKVEAVLGN